MATALPTGAGAADDAEPPPDPPSPLNLPSTPTPSRAGYLESGGVPLSLLAPSRWQVGDFALSSKASLSAIYDDNVEADDDDRDEDVFFAFSPAVRAQSLYARHSLGFGASGTAATALKNGSEDFFDWQVGADGRLDISRQSKVNAAISYRRDTEDNESIDAEDDDDDDVPIHVLSTTLGYNVSGDRIGWGVDSSVTRVDAEGGEYDDRDNTTLGLNASTRYKWSDRFSISAGPSYRYSNFDEDVADDGEGRDAQVISGQAGANYQASRTISTSAAVGYSYAAFEDSDRDDEDSVIGNIGVIWEPGGGTTLDLRASRTLGLTIIDDADSRTTTTGSATLSHRLELGSRSALSSSFAYSISDYSDLDRTDHDVVAELGYAYRLTEHAFLSSSYRFSRRSSDDDDADFYRNLIALGITVSY